jgi:hypothetical protein
VSERRDEFYVGYLPTPPRVARLALGATTALLLCLSLVAAMTTTLQNDPGDGVWDVEVSEFTGPVALDPAPYVLTPDGAILVVDFNKFGARERLAPVNGANATLRGTIIRRDGVRLLELSPTSDGVEASSTGASVDPASTWRVIATETLVGEITDPKCYLGAMKPGRGITHRSCAALCISGGIPPLFVVEREGAMLPARTLVLVNERGEPIEGDALARLLTFVGERSIAITGEVWRSPVAPFEALRVDVNTIMRR